MKLITNELKRFINTYCSESYNEISKLVVFRPSQINILQTIHQCIMNAHVDFHHNAQIIEIENIPKGKLYNDIDKIFIQIIENTLIQQKTFKMTIGARTIYVSFFDDKSKSHSSKKWDDYLKKIYMWLTIISTISSNLCVKNLYVYIYLTHEKKQYPPNPATELGTTHANTAFTTSCTSNTEIHIYRQEEWFKVFIHETFHSYGLDFSTMNNGPANKKMREIFGVQGDVRLFESYCEIWGEIIHLCFLAHFEMVHSPKWENLELFVEKVRNMLVYEIVFSQLQSAKVLKHNHLTYDDIIHHREKVSRKYKEKPAMFSYHVIKSILLFFANDFIEWTMIHNRGSFNFQKTQQNIDKYIQFIREHSADLTYINTMKMTEQCLDNATQLSVFRNDIALNTLRMTLHEM